MEIHFGGQRIGDLDTALFLSGEDLPESAFAVPAFGKTGAPGKKWDESDGEKAALKAGKIPEDWQANPAKLAQKDRDARWMLKRGRPKNNHPKPCFCLPSPMALHSRLHRSETRA